MRLRVIMTARRISASWVRKYLSRLNSNQVILISFYLASTHALVSFDSDESTSADHESRDADACKYLVCMHATSWATSMLLHSFNHACS